MNELNYLAKMISAMLIIAIVFSFFFFLKDVFYEKPNSPKMKFVVIQFIAILISSYIYVFASALGFEINIKYLRYFLKSQVFFGIL